MYLLIKRKNIMSRWYTNGVFDTARLKHANYIHLTSQTSKAIQRNNYTNKQRITKLHRQGQREKKGKWKLYSQSTSFFIILSWKSQTVVMMMTTIITNNNYVMLCDGYTSILLSWSLLRGIRNRITNYLCVYPRKII